MKKITKFIFPLIFIALVFGYLAYRAPHFSKETSAFNSWIHETVETIQSEQSKQKDVQLPEISITARNISLNQHLFFKASSAENANQTVRLITLANETNFKFKEYSSELPSINDSNWLVSIKKSGSNQSFYAEVTAADLKNDPAGLNFIQLMRMWSK